VSVLEFDLLAALVDDVAGVAVEEVAVVVEVVGPWVSGGVR
jgi:hypothetical protein